MNKLHYLTTLFGIIMVGVIGYTIYSPRKDRNWVKFDQGIIEGSKTVTYADMESIQIMKDGYIAFKLILNNETNQTSDVQTIFLGCKQKLYSVADYTHCDKLNGAGKVTLYGKSEMVISLKSGSPMERFANNICPAKS